MTPESFVVQIYRPRAESGNDLAGVVQRVGSERKQPFKSAEELWALLTGQPASNAKRDVR